MESQRQDVTLMASNVDADTADLLGEARHEGRTTYYQPSPGYVPHPLPSSPLPTLNVLGAITTSYRQCLRPTEALALERPPSR